MKRTKKKQRSVIVLIQEDRVIGEFLDAAKEETITALRAELARLQQSQHAQQAADSALASLQQKIDSLQVGVMLTCCPHEAAEFNTLIHPYINSFVCLHSCMHSFIYACMHSLLSFTHPFLRLFIHSYIQLIHSFTHCSHAPIHALIRDCASMLYSSMTAMEKGITYTADC